MTVTTLCAALFISLPAFATDDPLTGRFTLDAANSDDPAPAVEEVVASVGRLARGRARSQLTRVFTPAASIEIELDGESYLFTPEGGETMRLVPGGDPIEVRSADGETIQVETTRDGESLVMQMRLERGTRTQTVTPTGTGLRMSVEYILDIADAPVTLEFSYLREALE